MAIQDTATSCPQWAAKLPLVLMLASCAGLLAVANATSIPSDMRRQMVIPENEISKPIVINKHNRLVVGAGSNASLACKARGSSLTFVWFQDENYTSPNGPDQPATTKLLEEKRYEIAEEYSSEPNVTISILYLFDVQQSDTGSFLCLVQNSAGTSAANFSLIVNDSPPASSGIQSAGDPSRSLSLIMNEAQVSIVVIAFILILVVSIILILLLKLGSTANSSKDSQSGDSMKKPQDSPLVSGRQSSSRADSITNRPSPQKSVFDHESYGYDEGEDDEAMDDDERAEDTATDSDESTSAKAPKTMAAGELNGFIEHMRSGIINMDYHSMSPVIQFNSAAQAKQQQQQQHQQQQQQQQQHLQHQQQQQQQQQRQYQIPVSMTHSPQTSLTSHTSLTAAIRQQHHHLHQLHQQHQQQLQHQQHHLHHQSNSLGLNSSPDRRYVGVTNPVAVGPPFANNGPFMPFYIHQPQHQQPQPQLQQQQQQSNPRLSAMLNGNISNGQEPYSYQDERVFL